MPGTTPVGRAGTALAVGLTIAIVELTLITAYIHLTLGGTLFTLNALGYAALAAALALTAVPHPFVRRFAWLPRVGLGAYAVATIVGYIVIGPYFTLGWIAKGIEVAILVLLAVDLIRLYGSPSGLVSALSSLRPDLRRSRPHDGRLTAMAARPIGSGFSWSRGRRSLPSAGGPDALAVPAVDDRHVRLRGLLELDRRGDLDAAVRMDPQADDEVLRCSRSSRASVARRPQRRR